jgi:hypothetical protein
METEEILYCPKCNYQKRHIVFIDKILFIKYKCFRCNTCNKINYVRRLKRYL